MMFIRIVYEDGSVREFKANSIFSLIPKLMFARGSKKRVLKIVTDNLDLYMFLSIKRDKGEIGCDIELSIS